MPDWRNPDDYIVPRDFPNFRWAWEFLRRNPDYRKDWAAVLQRYRARGPKEYGSFDENVALHDREPGRWHPDPDHPDFFLPEIEREKWSLSDIFNPATSEPRFLRFELEFGFLFFKREGASVSPAGKRYPWAFFDLELPLKPQLRAVETALAAAQQRHGIKPHRILHYRNLWPRYLRLLDADLDGRTPKQIADALASENDVPDEKKVWDQLQSARRMTRPEGYLSIWLSS